MNAFKILLILLIVTGSLGLMYGTLIYAKDTQEAKLVPTQLSAQVKKTENLPLWVGLAAIVAGVIIRRRQEKSPSE